jgi:hypothetical protein
MSDNRGINNVFEEFLKNLREHRTRVCMYISTYPLRGDKFIMGGK